MKSESDSELVTYIRRRLSLRWGARAPVGCDDGEIAEISQAFGGPLPKVYETFMRLVGKSTSLLLPGEDLGYPTVLAIAEWAEECLAMYGVSLPHHYQPFFSHHGYVFCFLVTGTGDDPEVTLFTDTEREFRPFGRLSEFLLSEMQATEGFA